MQKKLIALAVAGLVAAPAFAQSNVTIGGYLSLTYKNYKTTHSLFDMKTENRLDDDWNSRFWLTGSEDLGGGMKALFRIEQRLNLDTGNAAGGAANGGFAAGESYLGLSHDKIGLFTAGRRHVYFTEGTMWDLTWGQSTSSLVQYGILTQVGVGGVYQNNLSRVNNLLTWQSPVWSGFQARLDYSFAPYVDEGKYAPGGKYNKGGLWGATFSYNNGPLGAYFTYIDSNAEGRPAAGNGTMAGTDWHGYRAGVKYLFPFGLQVALQADRSTLEDVAVFGDLRRTAWTLPVKYISGPHTASLTLGKAGKTSGIDETGATMWSLGYQYALSKRSYVGVNWAQLKNKDNSAYQIPLAGTTMSGTAMVFGEKTRVLSATFAHLF